MSKIEIRNVSFKYQENPVLKNINFQIEQGKYYLILGHNGSGKSTLAKIIAGLIIPDSGEILIDNQVINCKSIAKLRKKIGIVFQNPDNQFIGGTVKDDIAFGLENRQIPQNQMDRIILDSAKQVSIEKMLEKEPGQLSGGQKQRVAIAGIIALTPEIIIFDEATSMLDPLGREEVNALIKKMRQENPDLTIISITHDVEEALNADRLIVMNDGNIIASGKPIDVFKKVNFPFYQLDYPFVIRLANELKSQGLMVNDEYSIEGMVDEICRLIS